MMGPNVPIAKTIGRIMAIARLNLRKGMRAGVHPINEE
jgi:hypothetical protein